MNFEEFEKLVEESLDSLPQQFKDILIQKEIKIIPRAKMPRPLKAENPGSVVFGVFIGVPLGRFVDMQTEPTRIELYKESFDQSFKDPEMMKEQVRTTVIHEVAHYFGFSEKEIRNIGY